MMGVRNGQGQPVSEGMFARIGSAFRYALGGNAPAAWFGPMEPIAPAVPDEAKEQAGVAGRAFDYQVGYNVNIRPRHNEAISFETLRAMADAYDPVRLLIETRKDQIVALQWTVKPKDAKAKPDARCQKITDLLWCPDHEHDWNDWLRLLLEDLLVLDAPAVYKRRTRGGDLWGLEVIDGSTIKRVIDETGRTPTDGPAYQQILKGVPAVDYDRTEIIYKPRNKRPHKVYGMSPVEQIINTVNIALRRQLFTLNYFTEGTVPDALAGVPVEWNIDQIRQFQAYWDSLLTDDQAARRKLRFVPGEIARNFHETKAPPLKDQFDEWLMRVCCFAFSIEPTAFMSQTNRATAETSRTQALEEGLQPLKQWVCELINRVIREDFGAPDLEFAWHHEEKVDPEVQSRIHKTYIDAKVLTADEVRADLGRDPLTPEQRDELNPPPPPQLAQPGKPEPFGGDQEQPPDKAEKAAHPYQITVNVPAPVVDVGATTIHAHIGGGTESQMVERVAESY